MSQYPDLEPFLKLVGGIMLATWLVYTVIEIVD